MHRLQFTPRIQDIVDIIRIPSFLGLDCEHTLHFAWNRKRDNVDTETETALLGGGACRPLSGLSEAGASPGFV